MRIFIKLVTTFLLIPYLVVSYGCSNTKIREEQNPTPPNESTLDQPPLPNPSISPVSPYWDLSDTDISKVSKNRKLIAFTFDDGPAATLQKIIGVYLHFNATHPDAPASATIFCNGKNINEQTLPDLQTAYAAGFELGNHTHNHKNFSLLSEAETKSEIETSDRLLKKIDGKAVHLLRTPYGSMNDSIRKLARAPIINWFIDTLDWTEPSPEEIYSTVWETKSPGVIVLMHDGYDNTVSALNRLLPDLYDAGYQVVGVSQMAKAHGCRLLNGGVYTRARQK